MRQITYNYIDKLFLIYTAKKVEMRIEVEWIEITKI